jgi:hypothetical protein
VEQDHPRVGTGAEAVTAAFDIDVDAASDEHRTDRIFID